VVLVQRQGLLAWVRASPGDSAVGDAAAVPAGGPTRPASVNRRLVAAFAELILNRRPEGAP
jgi:hypothetical protein